MAIKTPLNIILLGDPGAGKATLAEHVCKKYNMYDFDMGKELTLLRNKNSKVSEVLESNYDKGKLAPSKMVQEILKDTIARVPKSKGIIFDGHPKMIAEAKLVIKLLKQAGRSKVLYIYIGIPRQESVKRVLSRKGYFKGKYGERKHDTLAGLRNRYNYYKTNIEDVHNFFQKKYPYVFMSGLGSKLEVRKKFIEIIERYKDGYLGW